MRSTLCAHCGTPFTPLKPWGKYCREECGDKARHLRYYRRKLKALGRTCRPYRRAAGAKAR